MVNGDGESGSPGARGRIVIVDDDDAIVETLEEVLEAEGYDVQGFVDPLEALEALRTQAPPDILVLDCVMPAMDGPRLMEALAAEGCNPPVVLVTALSDPSFFVDPTHPHAARLINKPFDLDQLLETLDDIITGERARAAAGQTRPVSPKGGAW